MRWSILLELSAKRENFDITGKILMSRIIRKTKKKSLIFPLKKCSSERTQYDHFIKTSELSRNIMNRIITYSTDVPRSETEILRKLNAGDLASMSAMLGSCTMPPFGTIGERAIQRWFSLNLDKIYYDDKSVSEIFKENMKKDFTKYNSVSRAFRYMLRYDEDIFPEKFLLAPVSCFDGEKVAPGCFYSEAGCMEEIYDGFKVKYFRHPMTLVLHAARYISLVSAFLEDIIAEDFITCRKMIKALRCTEEFYEDTENDEYEEFASLVKYFEEVATGNMYSRDIDNPEAIRKWLIYTEEVMCDMVAKMYVKKYQEIMIGKYTQNLIEGSWCRTFKLGFDNIQKKMTKLSNKFFMLELHVGKFYDFMLDTFINAVVYYDTDRKLDEESEQVMEIIPDKYKKVYAEAAKKAREHEKLYLRFMMVMDFISDLSDDEMIEIVSVLKGETRDF